MSISRLESELLEAQARCSVTQHASLEQRREAKADLLRAERAFSMAKGEETTLACEWKILWEPNAPMPHVLVSEGQTYLMYVVLENSNWDGSSEKLSIALVDFIDCNAWKYGGPNVDVLSGHPLWGRGLDPNAAHMIAHSRWLAQEEKINQVHPQYNPDRWKTRKHYLLSFRDKTFECLDSDYTIELFRASLVQVAQIVHKRLFASESW
jgi:hypothetical protein